jgi:RNA polymerase sigma-B factor
LDQDDRLTDELLRRMGALAASDERREIRQRIIVGWIPMADRLAARYRDRGESRDDLGQVASLGLIKAVDGFDPDRGIPFAGYAIPTITGELKRHFRDHMWSLHVPRRVQELRSQVRAARNELVRGPDGAGPPVAAIAARAGLTEAETVLGLTALDSFSTMSLEVALTGSAGGSSLISPLGETDPAIDRVVDREAARPRLRELPDRERTILFLRFFEDLTQMQIAERMGISQMHVSRLISTTCEGLRRAIMTERPAVRPAP